MKCIKITNEFGLILRRQSLIERGVPWDTLLAKLEVSAPLDSNDQIVSFGPHFGQEALDTLVSRLSDLGLRYFDDFFEFSGDYPKWCAFMASVRETGSAEDPSS